MSAPSRAVARSAGAPRLHVESVGEGRPLVLLHGFALHGGLFAPLRPAFAQHHRVHVVDLPGHGYSDPIDSWTMSCLCLYALLMSEVISVRGAKTGSSSQPSMVSPYEPEWLHCSATRQMHTMVSSHALISSATIIGTSINGLRDVP